MERTKKKEKKEAVMSLYFSPEVFGQYVKFSSAAFGILAEDFWDGAS